MQLEHLGREIEGLQLAFTRLLDRLVLPCDICGASHAVYWCRTCGNLACRQHFDDIRKECQACVQRRGVHNG